VSFDKFGKINPGEKKWKTICIIFFFLTSFSSCGMIISFRKEEEGFGEF
jgi:hypothetical protein